MTIKNYKNNILKIKKLKTIKKYRTLITITKSQSHKNTTFYYETIS